MKDINKKIDSIYLEDFDVNVNPYLTYSQIQQIINAICKFETYSERKQSMDMLILYHATGIGKNRLENLGHDLLLQSGLIDSVMKEIKNLNEIHEGIKYTESVSHLIIQLSKRFPDVIKQIKEVAEEYGNTNKKRTRIN